MPDTLETADLEAQIEALISRASDRLRRQLEDVRRNAENAHAQTQDALTEAS
jgi:membrane protein YdbS with pleckstrin-like domain